VDTSQGSVNSLSNTRSNTLFL